MNKFDLEVRLNTITSADDKTKAYIRGLFETLRNGSDEDIFMHCVYHAGILKGIENRTKFIIDRTLPKIHLD